MQYADVKINYADGILRFVPVGEIDHHTAKDVREKMDEALFLYRPKTVCIVLSDLDFMDSSGLGLILSRYTKIQSLGGELILEDPTPSISKILHLAGVDKMIKIMYSHKTEECRNEKRKNK